MSRLDHPTDILILGGGPAGLALGRELKQRGLRFLILESGRSVGESWRQMPTRMNLVSPWRASFLHHTDATRFATHAAITREEFRDYLQTFAKGHALPVISNVRVDAVHRTPEGGFAAQTAQGTFRSRLVVNATGYFTKPFIPEIPGAATSEIVQVHFANYGDSDQLQQRIGRKSGPVLIVGKRLSAGQALVELVDAGFDVAVSHRSPIGFGPGPLTHWLFFRIFPEIERLKLWLQGEQAQGFDVKMDGGRPRRLLKAGTVKTFPGIRCIEGDTVVFEIDARLKPAAILYATGFRPALDHLRPLLPELSEASPTPALHQMESVRVPGLYFLGLDHQRNLQSRYLRGIRQDAPLLADRLQTRLAVTSSNSSNAARERAAVESSRVPAP